MRMRRTGRVEIIETQKGQMLNHMNRTQHHKKAVIFFLALINVFRINPQQN